MKISFNTVMVTVAILGAINENVIWLDFLRIFNKALGDSADKSKFIILECFGKH